MTETRTFTYKGFVGIGLQPRPGFVHCEIPALGRTVATRSDDLAVAEKLLRLTINHDCLTAEEVEERDAGVE